jgi:glycosyltransferase involved in cell wall biosynthesis
MSPVLSVVIPCYNETEVLPVLVQRLRAVLDGLGETYEVLTVDDGSTDGTSSALHVIASTWPQLRVVTLTRNAGHQMAITAGLDRVDGDFVVTMDADLQDPPELLPELLAVARHESVDVVYARRSDRRSDTAFKRGTATAYYRLMRRASGVDVPADVGDYRLMSRRVVEALRQLPERHRVYRLLLPWLGYPSAIVDHPRDARAAGATKYSLRRMVRLAVNSLTSFSTFPLAVAMLFGVSAAAISLLGAVAVVINVAVGRTVPGWASISVAVLFFAAVQLLCLGVLGTYLGRVYEEVQRRPLYVVAEDRRAGDRPLP